MLSTHIRSNVTALQRFQARAAFDHTAYARVKPALRVKDRMFADLVCADLIGSGRRSVSILDVGGYDCLVGFYLREQLRRAGLRAELMVIEPAPPENPRQLEQRYQLTLFEVDVANFIAAPRRFTTHNVDVILMPHLFYHLRSFERLPILDFFLNRYEASVYVTLAARYASLFQEFERCFTLERIPEEYRTFPQHGDYVFGEDFANVLTAEHRSCSLRTIVSPIDLLEPHPGRTKVSSKPNTAVRPPSLRAIAQRVGFFIRCDPDYLCAQYQEALEYFARDCVDRQFETIDMVFGLGG